MSVSSIAPPLSVSRSELNLGKIVLTEAGVLWLIGGGRLRVFWSKVCISLCACIGPGGSCLMEGVCNSLLTFLPLSSHAFIMEG